MGALISGTSAFLGYKNETVLATEQLANATNKTNEYIESINKEKEAIQERVNNGLIEQEYYKKLADELETLVDANGKVKEGYSDRVNFILNQLNEAYGTEYKIIDGTIEEYDKLKDNIYEIIRATKAKILLNANEEIYANAIKRQVENQTKLREQMEEQNKAQQAYNDKLKELEKKYGDVEKARELAHKAPVLPKDFKDFEELEKALDDSKNKVNELTNTIKNDNKTIIYWEDLKEATITEDSQKIEEAMANLSTTYSEETENQEKTLLDQVNAEIVMANDRKKIWQENGIEINDTRRKQLDTGIRMTAEKLLEQTNTVERLTDEQIEAWRALAEGSEDIYNEKISLVKEDTRFALEAILGRIDSTSPEYVNKWVRLADTSGKKYNEILSNLPDDTRGKILATTMAVTGMTPTTKEAYFNLSEEGKKSFNDAIWSMNEDVRVKLQSVIREADNQTQNAKDTTWRLGRNFAQGYINGINSLIDVAKNMGAKIARNTAEAVAKTQDSHSPSKVAEKLGNFFGEGYVGGIKDMIPTSIKNAKDLVQKTIDVFDNNQLGKFSINPNDFKIDTNQFIDYGQISGAIATQSNLNISSDIEGRIENAIYKGLSNATIPVEIEATTDEGIIFKKMQVKAREFYTQTGEPAFEF